MPDSPFNRRQFFRRGLGELLGPLSKAFEPMAKTLEEIAKLDAGGAPASPTPSVPRTVPIQLWLRPPGALAETKFRETCSKCGTCVTVCPAQCIKIDIAPGGGGDGFPYINADVAACVVCDSLACLKECPSGALVPTPTINIDMGTAVWREHLCVRTKGEECRACVDICPMGSAAIDLRGNEIRVMPLGCTGCGMCQQVCPTSPKSIMVIPKSARER